MRVVRDDLRGAGSRGHRLSMIFLAPSWRRRLRWRLAAVVLVAVAVGAGPALAETTSRERQLEARVAELERQVEQLLLAVGQQEAIEPAEEERPAGAEDAEPIQRATITPQAPPGTRFTMGGMVRVEAMATRTSDGEIAKRTAGRDFYTPGAIPLGGNSENYFDSHAKFSRLWFDASSELDSGDRLGARFEFDFYGGSLGNTAATNTYGATVRHAYLTWNRLLAGQTWSNFMDTAALLDSVDFIGPTDAVIFSRQPQIRYTSGPFAISLENPETTIQPYGGGPRVISGSNNVPDLIARYTINGSWGHFSTAGLVRQLRHTMAGGDTSTGFAATASGLFRLGNRTDLRYQVTGGEGFGRYIGLATIQQDAMVDARGRLDALGGWAAYAGLHHKFSPGLRGNVFYARSEWDNDTSLTGRQVTERAHSAHANLIWSPIPKLDFGMEAIWGERRLESGASGELVRLHTLARYSF